MKNATKASLILEMITRTFLSNSGSIELEIRQLWKFHPTSKQNTTILILTFGGGAFATSFYTIIRRLLIACCIFISGSRNKNIQSSRHIRTQISKVHARALVSQQKYANSTQKPATYNPLFLRSKLAITCKIKSTKNFQSLFI